jgi:hypothetical protein
MIYEGAFEQIRKRRLRVEPPPSLNMRNHSQKGVMAALHVAAALHELFPKGTNIE